MTQIHSLSFSNFFSNHIINTHDKSLSKHDRKIATAVSVILGFFTLGLIHGIVFLATLSLRGRVKKTDPKKPGTPKDDRPSKTDKTSSKVSSVSIKRNTLIINSGATDEDKIIRELQSSVDLKEYTINLACLTPKIIETLNTLESLTSLTLFNDHSIVKLPEDINLVDLEHLEKLTIHLDSLEPALAQQIANIKGLKHLNFDLYKPGDNSSNAFRELRKLDSLESISFGIIQYMWGTDEDGDDVFINPMILTHIFNIKGLQKIEIKKMSFLSKTILTSILSAKDLEEFHMPGCTDADADAITLFGMAAHQNLKFVQLGLKQVDKEVYDAVNALKRRDRHPLNIKVSPTFSAKKVLGRDRSFSQ
jgi:hypothetical protein